LAALQDQAPVVETVDVSGSVTAYWELLCRLWTEQRDFLLVEHDIVIAPATLATFNACPHAWCSAPSDLFGGGDGWWDSMLHCNRFRAEAMRGHPDLFTSMPPCARHWLALDAHSLPRLARRIGQPHCHLELLNQHLQGPRDRGGYPWPSEILNWAEPLFAWNVWLAQSLRMTTNCRRSKRRQVLPVSPRVTT
jgi:hypothetical protein